MSKQHFVSQPALSSAAWSPPSESLVSKRKERGKQDGWGGEWELLLGEGARKEAKRGSKGGGRGWAEAAATPRARPGAS